MVGDGWWQSEEGESPSQARSCWALSVLSSCRCVWVLLGGPWGGSLVGDSMRWENYFAVVYYYRLK